MIEKIRALGGTVRHLTPGCQFMVMFHLDDSGEIRLWRHAFWVQREPDGWAIGPTPPIPPAFRGLTAEGVLEHAAKYLAMSPEEYSAEIYRLAKMHKPNRGPSG